MITMNKHNRPTQANPSHFHGRVGLQQRVLPAYRAAFFNRLGAACLGGLSVFAGKPHPGEAITTVDALTHAQVAQAENHHFFKVNHPLYYCRQGGILSWLVDWDPIVKRSDGCTNGGDRWSVGGWVQPP
jgi:hypothetical protein